MKIDFKDATGFWLDNVKYRFTDTSMNRILEHVKNGAFMISAMRSGFPIGKSFEEFTPEEKEKYVSDKKLTEELKKDIRAAGLGYIASLGGYKENEGSSDEINVNEFSFVVPYNSAVMSRKEFVEFAIALAKKYRQDSVAIAGIPEIANGQIRYLTPAASIDVEWDNVASGDFSGVKVYRETDPNTRPYYTAPKKMGGRNIVFDSTSMNILNTIAGVHSIAGQAGHQRARLDKEIIIEEK